MPRSCNHVPTPVLLALLALAACDGGDVSPTAPPSPADLVAPRLPVLPPVSFRSVVYDTLVPTSAHGAETEIGDEDLASRPLQQLFNVRTRTGLETNDGYVFSYGLHDYIGNVGAVETTAHAVFDDKYLGSYTAERQDYTPFLLDFGTVKSIWAFARVYTDKTCGLTALGDSKHSAWWQFFQGRSAPMWGVSTTYSQAEPSRQPACASTSTVWGGGGDDSTTGMICYVLITWDLETGEVVDRTVLACTGTGNEQW
jgi:hypothetical protein